MNTGGAPFTNVINGATRDCPAGSYCPQGAVTPTACTDAALCPAGSKFEGGASVSCPAGRYQAGSFCQLCIKGFVCLAGATTGNPTVPAEGYECPAGHYCDAEESVTEIPCSAGKYRDST